MIEIKSLLEKFENILLGEEKKKEKISIVLSRVLKTEINTNQIEFKNKIMFLNIKPLFKNEIFLKKDLIIEELQKEFGSKSPNDIR